MADLNINLEQEIPKLTAYREGLSAQKTTLIEIKPIYGISELRDKVTETGSGTVTNNLREYACNVSGTSGVSELISRERARYFSGKEGEFGIGVRTSAATVTGDTLAEWGGLSDNNKMNFGIDSTGLFVGVLDDNVQVEKKYRGNWNVDNLDGLGTSLKTISPEKGYAYNVNFTWYGFGVVEYSVQFRSIAGLESVVVHRYFTDNKTLIQNPNISVGARVTQTTATNDFTVHVGGRQFSILGSYNPSFRETTDYVLGKEVPPLDGNPTPIMAWKQKDLLKAVDGKFNGITLTSDNQIMIEVYVADPSQLTGGTYGTPTRTKPSETSFESNKTATDFDASGGNIIFRDIAQGGGRGNDKAQINLTSFIEDIPEGKILVITGFATGTTASVDAVPKIREEF